MDYLDSFINGLLLSVIASCLALAIAVLGFGRTYHFSILMCTFAAVYVLAAWMIYSKRNPVGPHRTNVGAETSSARGEADTAVSEPADDSQRRGRVESFLKNPIPALLWSALQLVILIAILYSVFDIGAVYYG